MAICGARHAVSRLPGPDAATAMTCGPAGVPDGMVTVQLDEPAQGQVDSASTCNDVRVGVKRREYEDWPNFRSRLIGQHRIH